MTDPLIQNQQPSAAAPSPTEAPDSEKKLNIYSILNGNKGIMIAVAVVVVVGFIAVTAFFSLDSSDQYQGLIQKVQEETKNLQAK